MTNKNRFGRTILINKKCMAYFIKTIWGPGGQYGFPENGEMNFANKRMKKRCEKFAGQNKFLVYETGHKDKRNVGAKSVYAQGIVLSNKCEMLKNREIGVYIKITKRVNPKNGIKLGIVRKIINRQNMQAPGGLIEITKEQFNKLSAELEKCY